MATIKHLKRQKWSHDQFGYRYQIELSDGRIGETSDEVFMGMFKDFQTNTPPPITKLKGRKWDEGYNLSPNPEYETIF